MFRINGIEEQSIKLDECQSLYFATDIHGQYLLLLKALELLNFKMPQKEHLSEGGLGDLVGCDHLYLLGDNIDRGDGSVEMLGFARYNPAVKSIRGNHEVLAFHGNLRKKMAYHHEWMGNGGEWSNGLCRYFLNDLLSWANNCPDGYEITINNTHKVALLHAGIPKGVLGEGEDTVNWQSVKNDYNQFVGKEDYAKWDQVLQSRSHFKRKDKFVVEGVDAVLHGHKLVKNAPKLLGNRIYMDGGAGLIGEDHALTILEYKPSSKSLLGLFKVHKFGIDPYTGIFDYK
ncbi:putative Metallophos domain-containing protein [Vibrio chagasii]|nr:putative Metallophos domain-containing protein [Vibrio chagasii]